MDIPLLRDPMLSKKLVLVKSVRVWNYQSAATANYRRGHLAGNATIRPSDEKPVLTKPPPAGGPGFDPADTSITVGAPLLRFLQGRVRC